jgi:hypothetical protein
MNYTITIKDGGELNPQTLPCHLGDKITWTNQAEADYILMLPGCVRPQDGPVLLGPGDSSRTYTMFENVSSTYQHFRGITPGSTDPPSITYDGG